MNSLDMQFVDALQKMEDIPQRIITCFKSYSARYKQLREAYDVQTVYADRELQSIKETLTKKRDEGFKEADSMQEMRLAKLEKVHEIMASAERVISAKRSAMSTGTLSGAVREAYTQSTIRADRYLSSFKSEYESLTSAVKDDCTALKKAVQSDYDANVDQAEKKHSYTLKVLLDEFTENKDELLAEIEEALDSLNPSFLETVQEVIDSNIPAVSNYEVPGVMPSAVIFGKKRYPESIFIDQLVPPSLVNKLRMDFSFLYYMDKEGTSLSRGLETYSGRRFDEPLINRLILYTKEGREAAIDYLRAIEMRLFMAIPAGKLRVTMIDPIDLGKNFSLFSKLGDVDERIISTKIWSDPDRIKEQLNLLIGQISDVLQNCLRNEYKNIVEYNENIGKNAEPLHILLITDFPNHFDSETCSLLEKIISSGPECGVYTFIAADEREFLEEDLSDRIGQKMEKVYCNGNAFVLDEGEQKRLFKPLYLPEQSVFSKITDIINQGIKTVDRITITLDEVTNNITKHEDRWFCYSHEEGIRIPFGLEGARQPLELRLGGTNTTQHHALIVGSTGSGKTALIHTLLLNTMMYYSPDKVQIYFLDFKHGVSSKCFANAKNPFFRAVSLETEPEFGLSVLQELQDEINSRAQQFHSANVDDIESYLELPGKKMTRLLLIIDEYQEMLSDIDPEITKTCVNMLTNMIMQGRAMGVHLILASQTLPAALSGAYGNMVNRIALSCEAAEAKKILSDNNDAVNSISSFEPGRGIFNSSGGHRDANHICRIAYIPDEERAILIDRIYAKIEEKEFAKQVDTVPRLLLSTVEDDIDNPMNDFVKSGMLPVDDRIGVPLYIGEEISMYNDFKMVLTAKQGKNVLIIGNDPDKAKRIYGFAALSILFRNHCLRRPEKVDEALITFFDFEGRYSGSGNTARATDMMHRLAQRFPHLFRVYDKYTLDDGLEALQEEYKTAEKTQRHFVIFSGLNRAKGLLDTSSIYTVPLKQVFEELVRKGPERGYHYIIWANEPTDFCSFYSSMLPDFYYRLAYGLTEDEYLKIVASNAKKTIRDNNVIAYTPVDENKVIRIYNSPLEEWFDKMISRLENSEENAMDTDGLEGEF